ncbi:Arylsulfatase [Planctomycetes bacterium Pla163]|uniref:Arylsulfatase n=1 Tax=Rohdeia mirabilis TaxID=2528008 RepID=A0A518CVF6_9BACT|nr:Arylsulfatase [Planctomycetes bacterium Pla163]
MGEDRGTVTHATRTDRSRSSTRAAAALACALFAAACSDGAAPESADSSAAAPKNVLMVVVDTLRADRLGCYGAERDTSPNIDELAARGTRFARTQTVAPWTMPSIATLFTGLFPSAHGVVDATRALPTEAVTLAETFAAAGYSTGGVVSHTIIGEVTGYDQGFEYFDETNARGHEWVSTASVTDLAEEMLVEFAERDQPFFLFVHYFDPHYEYLPHDEFDFASAGSGRLDGSQSIGALRRMMADFTPDELAYLRDVYDEEIAHTDAGIGVLLAALDEAGATDDTVVLLTADHGEEFVEHGWLGHTRSLYQQVLDVPLVVVAPGSGPSGHVVDTPVSTVAVAPTVLELAGVAGPNGMQGASLAPFVRGESGGDSTPVLTEVAFLPLRPDGFVRRAFGQSILSGDLKLVRDEDAGTVVLYDLGTDPGERDDVADARPDRRDALLAELERELERLGASPLPVARRELSPALLERLAELGYVGAAGGDADEGGADGH